MMQAMNNGNSPDPEMQQLENMMDKIMDLQHPERVEQKLKEQSKEKERTLFTVNATAKSNNISLIQSVHDTMPEENKNAFFSLGESQVSSADTGNALHAVIHETQTLVNGAVIKLRLVQDAYINGTKIPAGNFIYGTVSLNNERLQVEISSIRFDNSLYPVKLRAYDLGA
jgi:conjugative transposon TraM protein